MKANAKILAAMFAAALFVAMGYTSLFAFQDFGDSVDADALPCPSPFAEPQDGLISTASILPRDELPLHFADADGDEPWVRSVKRVLRRIDSLEGSLDAYSGKASPAETESELRRSVQALGYGRAVERVLRRMKQVVGTYRSLSPKERMLLNNLDADSQVRLLEEARTRNDRIDSFLDYLSRRRAVHVEAMRKAAGERAAVAAPAKPAAPAAKAAPPVKTPVARPCTVETPKPPVAAGPSANMSGDLYENWESRRGMHPRVPAGHNPMPAPARDPEDIAAAAASLGADILAVTDGVVSRAVSQESSTYRQNEEKELGSVSRRTLERLALFGQDDRGEVTAANRLVDLSPLLRGLR